MTVVITTMRWRRKAACKGLDPNLFFPERGESAAAPKAICHACPVLAPCRRWATWSPFAPRDGIVAGLSEKSRHRLRTARGAPDYAATIDLFDVLRAVSVALGERRSTRPGTDVADDRQNGSWQQLHDARRDRAADAVGTDAETA